MSYLHDCDDLPIYGEGHADDVFRPQSAETEEPCHCDCEFMCPKCDADTNTGTFPAIAMGAGLLLLILLVLFLFGVMASALCPN